MDRVSRPSHDASSLLASMRCSAHKANGQLLLHNIADQQAGAAGGSPRQWLPGWVLSAPASGSQPGQPGGPGPSGSTSSSGPSGGGKGRPGNDRGSGESASSQAFASLLKTLSEAGQMLGDPAFAQVPVPTVYLGGLPAPIPAGRPTIDAAGLLQQLQRGVLPSDSLPEADRDVWRAATAVTDPISAFNIVQAQPLGGRKLLLTERGVAEQLARGAIQMVPAQGDGKRAQHPGGGGGGAWWNPLARLGAKLSEGRQLSKRVQQRAEDLGAAASKASGSGSSKQGSSSQGAGGSDAADASASGAPSSSDALAIVPAGPGSAPAVGQVQQYVLQEAPVRRILAGGAPPQLAWVPLRVALQLLRSLPQHFVLLQGAPFLPGGGRRKDSQRQQHQQQQPASTSQQGQAGSAFTAASAPADLSVHVIPGLLLSQATPDGGRIEFTPGFLSATQAQALWRDMREISGGALLMYRRLERAQMRQRLEAAAALITFGPAAAGAGGAAQEEEEEEGEGEEPPEINEFIRELGGSLAQEAGAGGLHAPSGGLPRLAATFACGVTSLAAGALCAIGDAADRLMMATPLGPRLLGVPESGVETRRLSELVRGMAAFNQQQAVMAALFQPPPPLSAQQQAAAQQAAAAAQQAAAQQEGSSSVPATAAGSSSSAAASDAAEGAADADSAEAAQRRAAAALHYSRTLAAAAIWLALGAKNFVEDPRAAGGSLGRMLARGFAQNQAHVVAVGGASRVGMQAVPSVGGLAPPPAPEAQPELEEALREVLAAGMPVLEHNGFQALWQPPRAGGAGEPSEAAAAAALAGEVAKCCTGSTALGLGAFAKDQASGGFTLLASPVGPLPVGKGLMLVGDLNLGPRRRGRSASRTTARFVTAAVGDARMLV